MTRAPPTRVVIAPDCVEKRPLGATAWSTAKGRNYDEVAEKDEAENNDDENMPDSFVRFMIDRRLARYPGFLDKWVGGNGGEPGKESAGN